MNAALFVGQSAANMRLPPCKHDVETRKTRTTKRSFTSMQMVHTHTHIHTYKERKKERKKER